MRNLAMVWAVALLLVLIVVLLVAAGNAALQTYRVWKERRRYPAHYVTLQEQETLDVLAWFDEIRNLPDPEPVKVAEQGGVFHTKRCRQTSAHEGEEWNHGQYSCDGRYGCYVVVTGEPVRDV